MRAQVAPEQFVDRKRNQTSAQHVRKLHSYLPEEAESRSYSKEATYKTQKAELSVVSRDVWHDLSDESTYKPTNQHRALVLDRCGDQLKHHDSHASTNSQQSTRASLSTSPVLGPSQVPPGRPRLASLGRSTCSMSNLTSLDVETSRQECAHEPELGEQIEMRNLASCAEVQQSKSSFLLGQLIAVGSQRLAEVASSVASVQQRLRTTAQRRRNKVVLDGTCRCVGKCCCLTQPHVAKEPELKVLLERLHQAQPLLLWLVSVATFTGDAERLQKLSEMILNMYAR